MKEGHATAIARALRSEGLRSYPLGTVHAHEVDVAVVVPAANGDRFDETRLYGGARGGGKKRLNREIALEHLRRVMESAGQIE